jgi:cyclophilin family peptidyl-prolyl cis-trans isomerase
LPQEVQNGSNDATEATNGNGQQLTESPVSIPASPAEADTQEETKNNKGDLGLACHVKPSCNSSQTFSHK